MTQRELGGNWGVYPDCLAVLHLILIMCYIENDFDPLLSFNSVSVLNTGYDDSSTNTQECFTLKAPLKCLPLNDFVFY